DEFGTRACRRHRDGKRSTPRPASGARRGGNRRATARRGRAGSSDISLAAGGLGDRSAVIAQFIAEPIVGGRDDPTKFKRGLFSPETALRSRNPTQLSGTSR